MEFDFLAFDRGRMFWGDASWMYLFEIAARVLIVYVYTILLLRFLGNEAMKNMNFLDYFMVISLGTASGDIMIYPSVPIIYCLVAISVAVLFKKALSVRNVRYDRVNTMIQADPVLLIKDGRIDYAMLTYKNLKKRTFFAMLRLEGIEHTREVRACYLEPNGAISMYKNDVGLVFPGESVLPPETTLNEQEESDLL